jgi:anthranilate synthase/phosphoribosyltransferase
MILLLDNYDSFTHNIYQYLSELTDEKIEVIRNDRATVQELLDLQPTKIILSPGPGRPEEAGVMVDLIKESAGKLPILGVCLGHQAIGYAFGADIIGAKDIVHGKAQEIQLDGQGLFRNFSGSSTFTRYHSLVVDENSLPGEFEITARSADGEIMGIRHKEMTLEGVQFHPESIASEEGKRMLKNFLNYRREPFNGVDLLKKLMASEDLTGAEASSFMEELTDGNLEEVQIAAILAALGTKGPAAEEIAGCAGGASAKACAYSFR